MLNVTRRLLVFLLILSAADHARADSYEAAYEQGMQCFRKLDCRCALSWFEEARAKGAPAVVWYEIGEMQKCLQHTVEAEAALSRYLADDPEMPSSTRALVESERAQLDEYLAKLLIETDVPAATISVDDRLIGSTPLPAPVKLLPGRHVVTKTSSTGSSRREISLREGESARIVVAEHDTGVLNVACAAPDVRVEVDGVRTPAQSVNFDLTLAAGMHRISFSTTSLRGTPHNVEVPVGGRATVVCAAPDPVPTAPRRRQTSSLGYIGIAAGGAVGAAAAVLYLMQHNDYEDWQVRDARLSANPTALGSSEEMSRNDELASSIHRERVMAAVLGVSGGALIAAGAAVLAWDSVRTQSANRIRSAPRWTATLTDSSAVVGWRSTW